MSDNWGIDNLGARRAERFVIALQVENAKLRAALLAVEWAEMERCCPWCSMPMSAGEHRADCARQIALGIVDVTLQPDRHWSDDPRRSVVC